MEKYFELRMWQDYIIPAIIILLAVVLFLVAWSMCRFATKMKKREDEINDRLWKKYEEREENEGKQT